MEPFYIWPLTSAVIYALAAILTKRALAEGVGVLRFTFIGNVAFAILFTLPLLWVSQKPDWSQIHWPIIVGLIFFLGQILTVAAIRVGDVSVQSPLMGSKVVFVAFLSAVTGVEVIGPNWWSAAAITALAVFLMGFSDWKSSRNVWLAVALALLSALAFACSDVAVITHSRSFGVQSFLAIVMAVQLLPSIALIPFFREPIKAIPEKAWPWLVGAAAMMALQAIILNIALGVYQHATAFNVLYGSRGLWSIVLIWLLGSMVRNTELNQGKRIVIQRVSGAVLLLIAVALVLSK